MYFGEIANQGDTVHIITEPTITVSAYTRGLNLETQALVDSETTLTVDQANYFQFAVEDIESKVSHINWESLSTSSAAYALKDAYDVNILTYMFGQASSTNTIGTDSATPTSDMTGAGGIDVGYNAGEISPLNLLARASRLLDDNNVPEDGRWVVAKPEFWEIMADENSKLLDVDYTQDSDSKLRNGQVTKGMIRNFRCYKSNNIPAATSATGKLLFGHQSSTATASQIAKTEVLRSEDTFADKVRGLHVFGRKTLRTTALGLCYYVID